MTQAPARQTISESDRIGPGLDGRWPASLIWRDGEPDVRKVGISDLVSSVQLGFKDFKAVPTHLVFLVCIYPILGLILGRVYLGYDVLSLLYPVLAGLALVGPVLAIGLYEISRRREAGLPVTFWNGMDVFSSPSRGALVWLSLIVFGLFFEWLALARLMAGQLIGVTPPQSLQEFAQRVLDTPQGHQLIISGNLLGFVFAVVVLAVSVISFPMLVDRYVSAGVAVRTSIRACVENPVTMAAWGLFVAACLFVGAATLFIGLAMILPVLGHATWHLYRRTVGK